MAFPVRLSGSSRCMNRHTGNDHFHKFIVRVPIYIRLTWVHKRACRLAARKQYAAPAAHDEVSRLTSARVGNAFFFWQRTLSHNSAGAVSFGGVLSPETCRKLVNDALLA